MVMRALWNPSSNMSLNPFPLVSTQTVPEMSYVEGARVGVGVGAPVGVGVGVAGTREQQQRGAPILLAHSY